MGQQASTADAPAPAACCDHQDESPEGLANVQAAWRAAAGEGTHQKLALKPFASWAQLTGIVPTPDAASDLFRALDVNGDGMLTYAEFANMAFLAAPDSATDGSFLETIFTLYDLDHDGVITRTEMVAFLLDSGRAVDAAAAHARAERVLALVGRAAGLAAPPDAIDRAVLTAALAANKGLLDELFVVARGTVRVAVEVLRARGLRGADPYPAVWLEEVGPATASAADVSPRDAQCAEGGARLLHSDGTLVGFTRAGPAPPPHNTSEVFLLAERALSDIVQGTHVHNSREPRFNDCVLLSAPHPVFADDDGDGQVAPSPQCRLRVTVALLDRPLMSVRRTRLGECSVDAAHWPVTQQWVSLGAGRGEVLLSVRALAPSEPYIATRAAACPFSVHHSVGGGVATATHDGATRKPSYRLCVVTLRHVAHHFGALQYGWNRDYSKARAIFGKGPHSSAIRAMTRAAHAALYSRGVTRTETGFVRSAEDFLELFASLNDVRLTYVVGLDDRFRFSETGKALVKDFLSKHALHSCCAEAVRFAGEMWVHAGVVYVDNGSGTYAPAAAELGRVKALLQANFPGLQVETRPYEEMAALRQSVLGPDIK